MSIVIVITAAALWQKRNHRSLAAPDAVPRLQPAVRNPTFALGTAAAAEDYEEPVPVAMQDRTYAEIRDQPPPPLMGGPRPVYHEVQMYNEAPQRADTGSYVSLDGNQQTYSGARNQPGSYASLDGHRQTYSGGGGNRPQPSSHLSLDGHQQTHSANSEA